MVEARAGSLTGSLVEARKGGCGKSEIVRAYNYTKNQNAGTR